MIHLHHNCFYSKADLGKDVCEERKIKDEYEVKPDNHPDYDYGDDNDAGCKKLNHSLNKAVNILEKR